MPAQETTSGHAAQHEDVLTLAEAAAYLRVSEDALLPLLSAHALPAQKIGDEWRFLKRALEDWLRFPVLHPRRDFWLAYPHWILEDPFAEELLTLLADRLLHKLKQYVPPSPKPGSKQAVLKHFGIFRDDDDLEERLADARAWREAAAGK